MVRRMGLRFALGLGLVMAAAGDCPEGQCPSKRNAGVRLLQQNQRLARQNLESSTGLKASVHSSVLQKMMSKPVPLQSVRAERSADGMTAFVQFEHDGFRHSYNLSAYDVYSPDAQLFMQTSEGSQPLPREPSVFRSRSPQMWATARLHADGSVTGLFEEPRGGRVLRVDRGVEQGSHSLQFVMLGTETSRSGSDAEVPVLEGKKHMSRDMASRDTFLKAGPPELQACREGRQRSRRCCIACMLLQVGAPDFGSAVGGGGASSRSSTVAFPWSLSPRSGTTKCTSLTLSMPKLCSPPAFSMNAKRHGFSPASQFKH